MKASDSISRQAAIDEITEYGSGDAIYMSVVELKRRIEQLPSAQPDVPDTNVGDMISRQAAIDMAVDMYKGGDIVQATYSDIGKALVKFLNLVPSAQSEIIRCKDCAKREYCRTSTIWAVAPDDDWYCADAERVTNGIQ